jgi:hypothetical protein
VDLEGNPGLRAELEAARACGVPWRRWAGWEPAEVTTYEYDDDGRLIRSTTVREAEWGEVDRGAMLALAAYEASICTGCRQPMSQSMDPDTQFKWRGQILAQCHACYAVGAYHDDLQKQDQPQIQSLRLGAVLRD